MTKCVEFLLFLYRKLKVRPSCCRYHPSCSVYFEEAIARHGLVHGSFLALKRLIRCNQWFPGGFDPVP